MTDLERTAVEVAGLDEIVDPTGAIPSRRREVRRSATESPVAEQVRAALEAYGQACMNLIRHEELVTQARQRIDALRADVATAGERLVELGIPAPRAGKKPVRPAVAKRGGSGPGVAPAEGTLGDRIIRALGSGALSAAEISEKIGASSGVGACLSGRLIPGGLVQVVGKRPGSAGRDQFVYGLVEAPGE